MIGSVVGNHRIVARINEGGMGVVYRAEHVTLGRAAAVKVLLPQYSHAREIVARFFNEARATSAVRHPNIVEVYDFGHLDDGQAFIVMEFLDGETLNQRLHARPIGEAELISLGRQIASALSAAHERGVIHRDLKPDNIMLVADGDQVGGVRPKIVDFGIAKLADPGGASNTRTGAMLGTPTYMSPEQCRGAGQVDHRSDLYSLGVILYEALAQRPPFLADGPGEVIAAHLFAVPAPLGAQVAVSPELEGLIMSLLSKRPDERPPSANAVVALFDRMGAATVYSHATVPVSAETMVGHAMPRPGTGGPTTGAGRLSNGAPTTLGGASGESTGIHAPRARAIGRPWIAAAAGILAAGVTAAVVIASGGESSEPLAPAAVPAAASSAPSTVEPVPEPAPEAVAAPAPVPVAVPAPTSVAAPAPAPTPETAPAPAPTPTKPAPSAEDIAKLPPPEVDSTLPAKINQPITSRTKRPPVRKPVRKPPPTRTRPSGPIETDL